MKKPWGGRFNQPTDQLVEEFTASIGFDQRLYQEDIDGSLAHVRMLAEQGIISRADADAIATGLEDIRTEIHSGNFEFRIAYEDIHMNIESRLAEIVGSDTAGRLHTGRSRNDQVALDLRLYMRRRIPELVVLLKELITAYVDKAEEYQQVIMPGFTHLQIAQPILFAHHMLAYCEMFKRDIDRLLDCHKRLDFSPLGSAAMAGSSFKLNRDQVAKDLGFSGVTCNSLDAVSDRDGVVELVFSFNMIMNHLSRFCEELVLWSTTQFAFVQISDGYCTGSSIMPQKKNPDVAELIRGKTGRVAGSLVSLLMTLKALPLAYNKDLQEDKEPLFDALDNVVGSLRLMTGMIAGLRVNVAKMTSDSALGFSTATEIADYLARRGLPFRAAHEVVGKVVAYCEQEGCQFKDLDFDKWRSFSSLFDVDLLEGLSVSGAVNAKRVTGGTAPEQVNLQVERLRQWLNV